MRSVMRYREQKYYYGNYMEVNMYPVYQVPRSCHRKSKRKPTSKVQERLNQINAERKLARYIPANFTSDDYKVEFTYSGDNYPSSIIDAKKDITNFFRRIKRLRKKLGLSELKYIYAFGEGALTGRIHFHVILSGGLTLKDLQRVWGKGYVNKVMPLMFNETGCIGIAKYFCQQQKKAKESGTSTIKDEEIVKRFVCSKNCIKPEPHNNDYKLTKKKVKAFAVDCENRNLFEKLYPDYTYAECKPFYNDDNGLYYLTLRMYRTDTELDMRNRKE